MIISNINNLLIKRDFFKIKNINDVTSIIKNTDLYRLKDGLYQENLQDDFYYILSSYSTIENCDEKRAEAHRKYIDIQCIISGEEKIGYADYSNTKIIYKAYDEINDSELFTIVKNETFFVLRENMYAVFFPGDIHRPGIKNVKINRVRKVIFKIPV